MNLEKRNDFAGRRDEIPSQTVYRLMDGLDAEQSFSTDVADIAGGATVFRHKARDHQPMCGVLVQAGRPGCASKMI